MTSTIATKQDQQPSWSESLLNEVIRPAQERNAGHAYFKEAAAGTLPMNKLAKWAADMLWITVRFPEIIAALASRCPAQDHIVKGMLLKNAFSEVQHPFMLAKLVKATGGEPDVLLYQPSYAYRATRHSQTVADFLTAYAFHHSFAEAVAAIGVGMETMTPRQCALMADALKSAYGFKKEDLAWLEVHAGEVEQEHASDALLMLEKYVGADETLRGRCRYAVERGVHLAEGFAEAMYRHEGPVHSA